MKHIELKMLTSQCRNGSKRDDYVSTEYPLTTTPADLMTKAMTPDKLIKFGRTLNLRGSFFTDLDQPAQ